MSTHHDDPWSPLRKHTAARIALGRAGGSLPTAEVLAFAVAHADARDAIHAELDTQRLLADLAPLGVQPILLQSQAPDRATYLQRPDLGRKLDQASVEKLSAAGGASDLAIILADGLSAPAVQNNAAPVFASLLPLLQQSRISLAPVTLVRNARVAIEDQIGQLQNARLAMILIGERPGLTTPASLGAYVVYNPHPQNTDADRNCVSNIHAAGLPPPRAAETLHYLITESLRRQLSGIHLKDTRPTLGRSSTNELG
jgi:ethanolamine ammonia-lyase small subunit